MTIYCGSDSVSEIVDGFRALKTRFPTEGLKLFLSDAEMLL